MYVYARDGLSYFLKVVKRYLGGTWQLMALVCKWEGAGGGTCKVKGNLLIKQSTFAECREGVQRYLGGVQPFTSSFLVYAVKNTQNSLFL